MGGLAGPWPTTAIPGAVGSCTTTDAENVCTEAAGAHDPAPHWTFCIRAVVPAGSE